MPAPAPVPGIRPEIHRDVVVIGAGPAGLMAARTLRAAGRSVAVLEARDRVGGRTWSGTVAGDDGRDHFIEIGGQWISPDQTRLAALVDELGLETFPRYRRGASVYLAADGSRRVFEADRLPVSASTQAEMDRLVGALDALAAEIGPGRPWAAPCAAELDMISFEAWLAEHTDDREAMANLTLNVASGMLTKPSHSFSALQAVLMAASAGSFSNLVDEDFILDRRVVGGMQSVSERMASELGEDLYLSSPVRRLDWATPDPATADPANGVAADVRDGVPEPGAPGRVVAHADRVTVHSASAVLAVPPNLYSRLQFVPPLPRELQVAHQHVSMGLVIKVHAVYPSPFWREEGLSGTGYGVGRLVQEVYDNTNYGVHPAGGAPGAEDPCGTLVAFISDVRADQVWALPPAARRGRVLAALAEFLGPRALEPIAFYLSDLAAEEWTRGAYAASFDLGGLHRWGHLQNRPIGPIHLACSDIAAEGYQHVDGAVRMGEAAALAILDQR